MEIYQPSTSSLRWFVFLARRTLNFLFLYFGCLMTTRNDYFLDWIFESFQSLLVPCVGLSIIWHLQTDKLRGLSRELVTTPPTYYQVWWTFIILILWSKFRQWIRISYLSSSYTTCQQGWFISRQQLSIICKTDTRYFGNVLKRG